MEIYPGPLEGLKFAGFPGYGRIRTGEIFIGS